MDKFINNRKCQWRNWLLLGSSLIWLISLVYLLLNIHNDIIQICFCIGYIISFSAWGHVFLFPVYYKNGAVFEGFIWGSILGISIASLITSVIVYFLGWNLIWIISVVIAVPVVLFSFFIKKGIAKDSCKGQVSIPGFLLFLSLLIVTLFFYFPYRNLGVLVGDRYLYAWLFGHDFINRMVHIESLSRGLPLEGFYFAGEKLSYYWLAYVYPAFLHNIKWIKLDIQQLLQITQLFYSLLATSALLLFLKKHVDDKKTLLKLTLLSLACYSYVGLFNIGREAWRQLFNQDFMEFFGYKLETFSGFSHGFYRFYLAEPQSILAISVILMVFSLYGKDRNIYRFVIIGLLLGVLFGIEATNGIMIFSWFIIVGVYTCLMNKKEWYLIGRSHFISVMLTIVIYIIYFSIEMYNFQTGSKVLQLTVNKFAVFAGAIYFPLIYGPLFLFGFAGLLKLFKKKETSHPWVYQHVILLIIALFFVFFITNPTEQHFGLLKATRVIPVCLLGLTCYLWLDLQKMKRIVLVLMILALPTLFTDNYIASNISDPSTYVRTSDMEAAKWIKENLPLNSIIQAEPNYPESDRWCAPKYSYSFIPIFAERPTAIGEWKVSSQEHSKIKEVSSRFHNVRKIYATKCAQEAIMLMKRYKIDYLFVGKLENILYGSALDKFKNDTYFVNVYSVQDTNIYRIKPGTI